MKNLYFLKKLHLVTLSHVADLSQDMDQLVSFVKIRMKNLLFPWNFTWYVTLSFIADLSLDIDQIVSLAQWYDTAEKISESSQEPRP